MSKFVLSGPYSRLIEHKDSRKLKLDGIESVQSRTYTIWALDGSNLPDPTGAWAILNAAAPASVIVDFVTLTKRRIINLDEVDAILGKFSAVVEWSHVSSDRQSEQRSDDIIDPANDEQIDFNFGPISQFYSQGSNTIASVGAPLGSNSNKININTQGKAEGFQFDPPSDGFSVTLVVPSASVTQEFIRLLACSRNSTNNANFRGWEPGEVCYTSCSGRRNSDGDWPVTFNFAVAKNETITTVPNTADRDGNELTFGGPVVVSGFDLLWVQEGTFKTGTPAQVVPYDKAAYISTFLPAIDLTTLGVSA